MRTWIIPDVHGCLLTLKALVEELIGFSKEDSLILLGDLIDRGPDSKGVMDYIMNLQSADYNITVLRGNHEDYMVKVIQAERTKSALKRFLHRPSSASKEWCFHGGTETLSSFGSKKPLDIPTHYIDWIEKMPYYIETEKYLIVHAGFNFKNEDIFADKRSMMWIREFEADPLQLNGRRIIHGHVPVQLDFIYQTLNSSAFNFIDLDNGVYMPEKPGYGNLLALDLQSLDVLVQPNIDF